MTREWCPKCQVIQNMSISNTENIEKDENDKDVKVTIKSYQCSECHSFIRSEEIRSLVNYARDLA